MFLPVKRGSGKVTGSPGVCRSFYVGRLFLTVGGFTTPLGRAGKDRVEVPREVLPDVVVQGTPNVYGRRLVVVAESEPQVGQRAWGVLEEPVSLRRLLAPPQGPVVTPDVVAHGLRPIREPVVGRRPVGPEEAVVRQGDDVREVAAVGVVARDRETPGEDGGESVRDDQKTGPPAPVGRVVVAPGEGVVAGRGPVRLGRVPVPLVAPEDPRQEDVAPRERVPDLRPPPRPRPGCHARPDVPRGATGADAPVEPPPAQEARETAVRHADVHVGVVPGVLAARARVGQPVGPGRRRVVPPGRRGRRRRCPVAPELEVLVPEVVVGLGEAPEEGDDRRGEADVGGQTQIGRENDAKEEDAVVVDAGHRVNGVQAEVGVADDDLLVF